MIVQTRQKSDGNWWCNLTAKGYGDVSFEANTILEAQKKMVNWMNSLKTTNVIDCATWEEPKYYPKKGPLAKSEIGYRKVRIDTNPIG